MDRKTAEQIYNSTINQMDQPHSGENNMGMAHAFIEIVKITQPKNILEIGFNRGSSALMWLLLSEANLTSIDVTEKPKSIETLKLLFENRFNFVKLNSNLLLEKKEWVGKFDLVFIDGNHARCFIESDLSYSTALEPKFIAMDDVLHRGHIQDFKDILSNQERAIAIRTWGPLPGITLFYILPKLP